MGVKNGHVKLYSTRNADPHRLGPAATANTHRRPAEVHNELLGARSPRRPNADDDAAAKVPVADVIANTTIIRDPSDWYGVARSVTSVFVRARASRYVCLERAHR